MNSAVNKNLFVSPSLYEIHISPQLRKRINNVEVDYTVILAGTQAVNFLVVWNVDTDDVR